MQRNEIVAGWAAAAACWSLHGDGNSRWSVHKERRACQNKQQQQND